MIKVFVDGQTGTTGLQIHERLKEYSGIELLQIEYEKRYDMKLKSDYINNADIVFLCLPDDAAKESASLVTNHNTKVIDASTAHRCNENWAYGLPELSKEHREKIQFSNKITNPGCHATAFVLSVFPLVYHNLILPKQLLSCQSITGYSGGGKSLIAKYEDIKEDNIYKKAPRPYALSLSHKHLPEMMMRAGLTEAPIFTPIVGDFYKGLATTVPIHLKTLDKKISPKELHQVIAEHYEGEKFINVMPYNAMDALEDGGFDVTACNDTNRADIFVFGNEVNDSAVIMTRLDNLGKGASGAAIQNMNIVLGFEEGVNLI